MIVCAGHRTGERTGRQCHHISTMLCRWYAEVLWHERVQGQASPVDLSSQLVSSKSTTKFGAAFGKAVGAWKHVMSATHLDIAHAVDHVSHSVESSSKITALQSSTSSAICMAVSRTGFTIRQETTSRFEDTEMRIGLLTTLFTSQLQDAYSGYSVRPSTEEEIIYISCRHNF